MTAFRFRLETLLKMRRDERDEQRQQYAKALEAQRILHDQIAQVQREIHETQQLLRTNSAPGAVDVDRLLRTHRYELLLQAQVQQLEQQAQRVAQEVERRRTNLLQADREVRLLEKLKERQFETFQRNEQRREQKALDEISNPVGWVSDPTRCGIDVD
jgi:flagellar FliJ protein